MAVYDLVSRAQLAALDAVRAGADCRAVDSVSREIIAEAGHGDKYGHGLGHGVGLEVHEGPRLAQTATGMLRTGNVVTVEPGVYLPGVLGVRIEDLVCVTDDGCEIVSGFTKSLVTLA
jgi:Xaa-Pro aminopeptidase